MSTLNPESSLRESIKMMGGNVIDMPDEKFSKWAMTLTPEQVDLLLEKHRSSRNFYKKILQEERRKTHPSSWRYEDAEKLVQKYNVQGSILGDLKKNFVKS